MTINYTENLGLKNPDTNEYFKTNEIYNYNNNIIDEFAGSTDSSSKYSPAPVTTTGTGTAYQATIPEWDGLSVEDVKGIPFTITPHISSTTNTCTLSVNGWPATAFRVNSGRNNGSYYSIPESNSIQASYPITLMFIGNILAIQSMTGLPYGGSLVYTPWSGNAIQNTFMLRDRTALPVNTDLNTVTTAGNYIVNADTNARNIINAPIGLIYTFILTVGYGAGNNQYPWQMLQDRFGTTWVRAGSGVSVTGYRWVMVTDCGSTRIGSEYITQDVNNCVEVGSYIVISNTANAPTTTAGKLTVEATNGEYNVGGTAKRMRQTYLSVTSAYQETWTRTSPDGGQTWSEWKRKPTITEIESLEARIAALESA